MDNISKHIGKTFQDYRHRNRLTQSEVAEMAGMEPRYISQIERGISKGSISTLIKLCNAYKITPDVILYDLLDDNVKKEIGAYEKKFTKMSNKDRSIILKMMDYLLEN